VSLSTDSSEGEEVSLEASGGNVMPVKPIIPRTFGQIFHRDLIPALKCDMTPIRYPLPGDVDYEEVMERGRRRATLQTALARICTCGPGCGYMGCGRNPSCIVHGWDDE
jgi:hypothetical protein